jgi:hypothetical protein
MISTSNRRASRCAALAAVLVGIAACGGGFSGPYTDANGIMKYTFKSGGKVEIALPFGAGTAEFDYEIKDRKLRINTPEGTQIFPIDEKGCFDVPLVGKMCRVKN